MIRTAIVTDWIGVGGKTSQEERDEIVEELKNYVGLSNIKVVLSSDFAHHLKGIDADLVIVDYGGLSAQPGSGWDSARIHIEHVRTWADNHPSSLVVIWTRYTARVYREVVEEFGDLPNIQVVTDDFGESWAAIRRWFDVPDPPAKPRATEPRGRRGVV